MEKTQTSHTRTPRRGEHNLGALAGTAAPIGVSYLAPGEFASHQATFSGRMIGAIAFGAQRPPVVAPGCPYAWVDMPVLNGEAVFEVWTSAQPVVCEDTGEIVSARNDEMLFGCLQMESGDNLSAATYRAYCRIFDYIDSRGYQIGRAHV